MNLLVNILLYQRIMKKMMIYFSKICYDVRYHPVKNQLKISLVCGETIKRNPSRGKLYQMI